MVEDHAAAVVRRRPRNEAEFAEVNGVDDALDGRLAAKLKEFTGPFLAAVDAVLSKGDAGAGTPAGVS